MNLRDYLFLGLGVVILSVVLVLISPGQIVPEFGALATPGEKTIATNEFTETTATFTCGDKPQTFYLAKDPGTYVKYDPAEKKAALVRSGKIIGSITAKSGDKIIVRVYTDVRTGMTTRTIALMPAPGPLPFLLVPSKITLKPGESVALYVGDASKETIVKAELTVNGKPMTTKGLAVSGLNVLRGINVIWDWLKDKGKMVAKKANTIALKLTDDKGRTSTIQKTVEIVEPPPVPVTVKKTCGCEKMEIRTTGEYSMSIPPEWTSLIGTTLGPSIGWGTVAVKDAAGNAISTPVYHMNFNFEVYATLKPDSNPALCIEGQQARGTWNVDGVISHKTEGEGKFNEFLGIGTARYGSDKWGDDDYNSPAGPGLKEHIERIIRWADAPGFTDSPLDVSVSMKANFQSFVHGPTGNCDCKFRVVIDRTLPFSPTATLDQVSCS